MQKKLLLILLTISLIPILIISVIAVKFLSSELEQAAINQSREYSTEVLLQIDGYLDKSFIALKTIASNPDIKAFDLVKAREQLLQVQKVYPENSFSLDDAKGNQVVRGDQIPTVNIWERPFFQAALKGQDEVVSGVTFSKNSNRYVVNLMTPIYTADKTSIAGVMQGSITLTKISDFVSALSTDGKTAYVVDSEGKVLAHPDSGIVKDRRDMSAEPFVQKALAEKSSGFATTEGDSEKKLVAYTYDDRTGWLVCVELPYSIIAAKTNVLIKIISSVIIVAILLITGLAFFVARKIARPIQEMQQSALKMAEGDLTHSVNIQSNDELGSLAEALNQMAGNLKKLIRNVQENSHQLASASEELTASAQESAETTTHVAASISEVAGATNQQYNAITEATNVIEKMSHQISQSAENANISSRHATEAATASSSGEEAAQKAIQMMTDIEKTVEESADAVEKLGARSKEIGNIIDTISAIANQTNLLALNAAIEAARAGEQGKGFAVVAEEVRKLAEQSQSSASQIAELILQIQQETDAAVSSMQIGKKDVSSGSQIVREAGSAFRTISERIQNLAEETSKTATIADQLSAHSQQAVLSLKKIDDSAKKTSKEVETVSAATEEQAASMQEISSSSHILANMAQKLQDTVQKFRI